MTVAEVDCDLVHAVRVHNGEVDVGGLGLGARLAVAMTELDTQAEL